MNMQLEKAPHILVIRLSAMGDVALMAPVLQGLLNQHPTLKISLLSLAKWAPIFKGIQRLTFIEAAPKTRHKGALGLWRLFQELSDHHFTAIADLHNVLRSQVLRLFFSFSSCPIAIIDKGRSEKKALTRTTHKIFKPLKHSSQRYADVFAALGYFVVLDKRALLAKPVIELSAQSQRVPLQSTIKIGVASFAAHTGKQYPLLQMREALQLFLAATNRSLDKALFNNSDQLPPYLEVKYELFFFGGGLVEKPFIEALSKEFEGSTHTLVSSFEDQLSCIAHLDLMLAMDSGNAHLAAMYGVPTLTLWGNTHPYAGFYPFLQPVEYALLADRVKYPGIPTSVFGNKVPQGYEKVMESITPEAVAKKMREILAKKDWPKDH